MNRTKNSIYNFSMAFLSYFAVAIIGFIAQKFFLAILGEQYNGVNGLFSNIISLLSVAELGLGTAIIYNLYKPIAENDKETIKALMRFYKVSYQKIAFLVMILGICILPFLKYIVGTVNIEENIYIIYILFLSDTVISYLLIYKQAIINGYQKNYIVNAVYLGYVISFNLLDIIILVFTKNYYLYLIVKIICRFVQNYIIKIIADKLFPFINEDAEDLDISIKKDIYHKVKALIYHKIGAIAILGSDNVIISILIGITAVGYYTNYRMVIYQVQTFFTQIFNSLTAIVGNLLVNENRNKNFEIYKKLSFVNFWLSIASSTCIFIIMDSFIKLWIGEKWILEKNVLFLLVINFYLQTMRNCINIFKEAAGIYYQDRFIPFVELSVNIIASVIFAKFFGLSGIFIGTIISNLVLHLFSYPYFVNTKIFGQRYIDYYKEFILKIFILGITLGLSMLISNILYVNNIWLSFIKNCCIAFIIPNVILFFLYKNSSEFAFFKQLLFSKIKKKNNY